MTHDSGAIIAQKYEYQAETVGQDKIQLVSVCISGQWIGLPITSIRDVFAINHTTPVPRAERAVVGLVNLRGHIVTILDLGALLHMQDERSTSLKAERMAVGVEWQGEVFGFLVDAIGDVLSLSYEQSEALPPNLNHHWMRYAKRVHKLDHELMIEVDIYALLDTMNLQAA